MTTFWIAFLAGTLFLILFSWFVSIKEKRFHGIPRFFAFEGILLLVLLNFPNWFDDPLSLQQLLSWLLLALSIWIAVSGFLTLYRKGRPEGNFENTTLIVRSGLFRLIRHPLYLSLFLLAAGACLKDPQVVQVIVLVIVLIALAITARKEEKEMIARFGDEYREYMKETRSFIPWIY